MQPSSVVTSYPEPPRAFHPASRLVAVVCGGRVPSPSGTPPRIGRAEVGAQAQEANKGRPLGIASNASSRFVPLQKGRSYLVLIRDFSNPSQL